jgi:hypothetical protein
MTSARYRPLAIALLVLLACMMTAGGAIAATPNVDLDELVAVGAKSWTQWAGANSQWTATGTLPNGVISTLDILRTPTHQRIIFTLQLGEKREEVLRMIVREGTWYVTDAGGRRRSKWRPYEMPTDSVLFYTMLAGSTPAYVDQDSLDSLGRPRRSDGKIATFTVPLDDTAAIGVRANLASLHEFLVRNPGSPLAAQVRAQAAQISQLVNEGIPTRVDLGTGQIIDLGSDKFRTHLTSPTLLKEVDESEFAIDNVRWDDHTSDPLAGDLNDLLMIGHFPGYQPSMKEFELDGRLMDVRTGQFRRIPFQGPMCMAGCFTKDRRAVIVSGMAPNGALRPYYVNLANGENRALGGRLFDSGFAIGATLSPDGQRIAVIHRGAAGMTMELRLFLIDIATGDATPVGEPRDLGMPQWMPDGKNLLVVNRQPPAAPKAEVDAATTKPATEPALVPMLSLMDFNGRLTPLRKGINPVILPIHKQIMYQDIDDQLWHVCDLSGQNDKLYGDGFKGFRFPVPAPDEQRLLIMKQEQDSQVGIPGVFPFGETTGHMLTTVPGLWGIAAWR